eukprot:NODE_628_length_5819_cov_0.468881.p4 type:complete len:143 gc:universal NODE_628_length_5819_cov_0.468881:4826-5254(+)
MDGEYEAPQIVNPEYKGEWKARMIDNPKYQGEWIHPEISNPEYKLDKEIYVKQVGGLAIDVWQVESGTLYSHVLLTNDEKEASDIRVKLMELKDKEEELKKAADEEKSKKAAKEAEKEAAEAAKNNKEKEADGDEVDENEEL